MDNLSMNQALSIWEDLWQAYYNDNRFGGDVAEIYAYRLMPYNPTYHSPGSVEFCKTDTFKMAEREVCDRAKESLVALLKKFVIENKCRITVNDREVDDWGYTNELFDWRCNVKVFRNKHQER
jgi:hypothetical protein